MINGPACNPLHIVQAPQSLVRLSGRVCVYFQSARAPCAEPLPRDLLLAIFKSCASTAPSRRPGGRSTLGCPSAPADGLVGTSGGVDSGRWALPIAMLAAITSAIGGGINPPEPGRRNFMGLDRGHTPPQASTPKPPGRQIRMHSEPRTGQRRAQTHARGVVRRMPRGLWYQ